MNHEITLEVAEKMIRAAKSKALWVLLTAAGARNHAAESSFRRMMSQ